jgi:O-antigen ligase
MLDMDFILIIAALVGFVWGTFVLVRGGLVAGALLVLLAGSCFGHSFYNYPGGPIPATADRVLLLVLAGQYLIYRRLGLADPKPITRTEIALTAFVALLVASTLGHDWQVNNFQPVARLLFYYLMPLALYWIVRQAAVSERALVWVFGSLAAFGVYLAATAVAENHGAWSWVFPSYIASPEYVQFFGRGRGPFLNPAGLGVFLGVCLCASLILWPRANRFGRTLLLLATPIYLWGIYSTLTRSVWMGAAMGVFVLACLTVPRVWRPALVVATLVAAVAVAAFGWEHLVAFKRDKDVSTEQMAESAELRPILATVAWHMFLDRPLLGCGFGQYDMESRPYFSDRSTDLPLEKARRYDQHNVFLALLAETGLVGAGLFVMTLAFWARGAWQLWQSDGESLAVRQCGLLFLATLGVYLANAMFHDLALISMVNMLLFFLAGITAGLSPAPHASRAISAARIEQWLCRAARQPIG